MPTIVCLFLYNQKWVWKVFAVYKNDYCVNWNFKNFHVTWDTDFNSDTEWRVDKIEIKSIGKKSSAGWSSHLHCKLLCCPSLTCDTRFALQISDCFVPGCGHNMIWTRYATQYQVQERPDKISINCIKHLNVQQKWILQVRAFAKWAKIGNAENCSIM